MIDLDVARMAGLHAGAPEEAGLTAKGLGRLTKGLQGLVDSGKIPGASAMIYRQGAVRYAHHIGAARPDGTSLRSDTIFRIYSMTKPIVSVAAMTLVEEGRLLLSEPLAKYIPAFATTRVGVQVEGKFETADLKRPITIQDLMRHTSGISYGFTGVSPVNKAYHAAKLLREDVSCAEHCESLASLPLQCQPGEAWEYGHSTDVLGRVLEIVESAPLSVILKERIFEPLGMTDTAFHTPSDKLARRAELISAKTFDTLGIFRVDSTAPPALESGGGGLVSTLPDYARFCAMLLKGGQSPFAQILSPRLFRFMTANHLPPACSRASFLLSPGYGFGLGFAVREQEGIAAAPGTLGEFNWGGAAGTAFWIAPADQMFAILMIQTADHSDTIRPLFRNLVYGALA